MIFTLERCRDGMVVTLEIRRDGMVVTLERRKDGMVLILERCWYCLVLIPRETLRWYDSQFLERCKRLRDFDFIKMV